MSIFNILFYITLCSKAISSFGLRGFFIDVICYRPVRAFWLLAVSYYLSINPRVIEVIQIFLSLNPWAQFFTGIFLFRYVRLVVHMVAFSMYRSYPVPRSPTYSSDDVTVIVPSVNPHGEEFEECIESIHANRPKQIVIVTVGADQLNHLIRESPIIRRFPRILCCATNVANKRLQVVRPILNDVKTSITVLCDDHVFWPPGFLPQILAPFENRNIGSVGTCKRVRRVRQGFGFADFWNFIGALYLERHNFEITATNQLDGGVFVVSGRTSAHRTAILKSADFIQSFLNDHWLFGLVGPMNVDDDNFITRWMVNHGWQIAIQNTPGALIETTLGECPKFLYQCVRWVRTTWRSNLTSLLVDRTVWRTQPWCVYAVYLTSLVNFALFYDVALFYSLWRALSGSTGQVVDPKTAMAYLGSWMFCSKMVKPLPHFWRNLDDLVYLPGYLLFGYYHSLIKLYALFTTHIIAWGSRADVDPVSSGTSYSASAALLISGIVTLSRKAWRAFLDLASFAMVAYCVHMLCERFLRDGLKDLHSTAIGLWSAAILTATG